MTKGLTGLVPAGEPQKLLPAALKHQLLLPAAGAAAGKSDVYAASPPKLHIIQKTQKAQEAGEPSLADNLRAAFKDNLLIYHKLDGKKDGSGLTGVQYPPLPAVKNGDEASLRSFIDDLSDYLSKQDGIDYKAPASKSERDDFRAEIAKKALPAMKAHLKTALNNVVDSIQDPRLQSLAKTVLKNAPAEFFLAPSSSSGKYHPADEINKGGLILHTIRAVKMGQMLAKYFGLSQKDTDEISTALLLHDVEKGGIPWRGVAPNYGYDSAHGPIAGVWLRQFLDPNSETEKAIDKEIANHMAQWNKPLPTPPQTLGQQIVSYADYLGSLDTVYLAWK